MVLVVAALVGCGDDGGPARPATTRATTSTPRSTLPPTTEAAPTGQLSRAESCRRFYVIVADLRLNDAQSATAFSALARQTADPTLAGAIQRVANGFARNAENITLTEIQRLCP